MYSSTDREVGNSEINRKRIENYAFEKDWRTFKLINPYYRANTKSSFYKHENIVQIGGFIKLSSFTPRQFNTFYICSIYDISVRADSCAPLIDWFSCSRCAHTWYNIMGERYALFKIAYLMFLVRDTGVVQLGCNQIVLLNKWNKWRDNLQKTVCPVKNNKNIIWAHI